MGDKTDLNGPPENGGNPSPKTAPISPSRGVLSTPSWWENMASFTNLQVKTNKEDRHILTSELDKILKTIPWGKN